MAHYNAFLLAAAVLLAASAVIVGEMARPIVSESTTRIMDVAENPQMFANRTITLEGTLRIERDYWGGGIERFYLEDGAESRFEIFSWKPLEVYRPPNCATCNTPATMMEYLGKGLALSGTVMEAPNEYYDAAAGRWIANGTRYVFSVSDARIIG
ncbi:MAG: hypothetical protein WC588_03640 [Candidatus Micrarchaeia archaeon]